MPRLTSPARSTGDQDSQEVQLSWGCGLTLEFFVRIKEHRLGTLLVERKKSYSKAITLHTPVMSVIIGWGRPKVLEVAIFTPKKSRR